MKNIDQVIKYIEEHLDEKIDYGVLADLVGYSIFYFHRIFTMLFEMTVGEYVRYRRLSEAAKVIQRTKRSVLDIALQYGYQTPEGFFKAFKQFHGCSPIEMRKKKVDGRYVAVLSTKGMVEGHPIYYTVKELPAIHLALKDQIFLNDNSSFIQDIQKYWQQLADSEEYTSLLKSSHNVIFKNAECIAIDRKRNNNDTYFTYGVGVEAVDSWSFVIPSSQWLVFPCIGPVNTSLKKVWKKLYCHLLKNHEYQIRFDYNLEVYYSGDRDRSDYKCEIWIPVIKGETDV